MKSAFAAAGRGADKDRSTREHSAGVSTEAPPRAASAPSGAELGTVRDPVVLDDPCPHAAPNRAVVATTKTRKGEPRTTRQYGASASAPPPTVGPKRIRLRTPLLELL